MKSPRCDRQMDEGEFHVRTSFIAMIMTGGISNPHLEFKSREWSGAVHSSNELPRQGYFCVECGAAVMLYTDPAEGAPRVR